MIPRSARDELNFLVTNRIPRIALSRLMGRISRIEMPLVARPSIALWHLFCDVDLTDAAQSRFRSLHDGFTRRLKPGARSIDAGRGTIVSPCDAIVGAMGRVENGTVLQVKDMPYPLADLLGSADDAAAFEGGVFVTLRLTAGMYHRFHAPDALSVRSVRYIAGDCWNVNPPALQRIAHLYCRNERAAIDVMLASGSRAMIVPVAAVLVSGLRLPFLPGGADPRVAGEGLHHCSAPFARGEEMGWFEHGSTIVMMLPPGHAPDPSVRTGDAIRMGQPLLIRDVSGA